MAQAMVGLGEALVASQQQLMAQRQRIVEVMSTPQVLHVERDEDDRLCGAYITRGAD